MKRQASVGMLYLKTILAFTALYALVHLTSCAASKNSCHGNGRKYYVAKDVRKAQSRHTAYRH